MNHFMRLNTRRTIYCIYYSIYYGIRWEAVGGGQSNAVRAVIIIIRCCRVKHVRVIVLHGAIVQWIGRRARSQYDRFTLSTNTDVYHNIRSQHLSFVDRCN